MKNILVILGTRPEAIKLAPVILELNKRPECKVWVCNTEQQKELSNQTLAAFGIKSDFNLDVMRPNQSLGGVQARILTALEELFSQHHFDATIVQGDTMTVLCGALVSYYHHAEVFHVEAGLRSYDLFEPFPEEAIRQMTARIATAHFAPTPKAAKALTLENIAPEKIFVTGNTVIDALYALSPQVLAGEHSLLAKRGIRFDDKLVLVTVHRRENHGERLEHILRALGKLAQEFADHQFILPVHPNPNVHNKVFERLGNFANVILTEPLDYPALVCLMQNTKLVLTDSGGIQEEAPSFGNPVLVMRYETERMEGVEAGFAKLVGADEAEILRQARLILQQDKAATRKDGTLNPFGDGQAAVKIAQIITLSGRKADAA
ncbi:MAG: UDP-N-acetylglucosamine 2-epimerase (non-hydrolyzing) [Alphaproteobacteria bacterium]|nr:UDP-N-acetylglucosamine 2-epimerase (non-hydrolyzing) [Alphaproteobacteria bacterium]